MPVGATAAVSGVAYGGRGGNCWHRETDAVWLWIVAGEHAASVSQRLTRRSSVIHRLWLTLHPTWLQGITQQSSVFQRLWVQAEQRRERIEQRRVHSRNPYHSRTPAKVCTYSVYGMCPHHSRTPAYRVCTICIACMICAMRRRREATGTKATPLKWTKPRLEHEPFPSARAYTPAPHTCFFETAPGIHSCPPA